MRRFSSILAVAISFFAAAPVHARLAVRVGSASGAPGSTVSVGVVLDTDRGDVSGMANTIGWAAPLRLLRCTADPVAPIASFAFRPTGCEAQQTCTSVRGLVLSFGDAFAGGDTLYVCDVAIAAGAVAGVHSLPCSAAEGGSETAETLAADCLDGEIEVVVPTPTATRPTATPSSSPTATEMVSTCAGDCDGDERVAIEELITAVRIALGTAAPERCAAADADGDAAVAIAELVRGVASALRGC